MAKTGNLIELFIGSEEDFSGGQAKGCGFGAGVLESSGHVANLSG